MIYIYIYIYIYIRYKKSVCHILRIWKVVFIVTLQILFIIKHIQYSITVSF